MVDHSYHSHSSYEPARSEISLLGADLKTALGLQNGQQRNGHDWYQTRTRLR